MAGVWEQTARAFPQASIAQDISAAVIAANTPMEMLREIRTGLSGTSNLNQRILGQFMTQGRAYQRHKAIAGRLSGPFASFTKITPFSLKPKHIGTYTSLNINSGGKLAGLVDTGLSGKMTSQIQNLFTGVGAEQLTIQRFSRPNVPGSMLNLRFSGEKLGRGFTLSIPEEIGAVPGSKAMAGVISSGFGQRTQNIVGQFGIVEGSKITSTLKYQEWVMLRAQTELMPKIAIAAAAGREAEIGRLVRGFHNDIRDVFEYMPRGVAAGGPHDMLRAFNASSIHLANPMGGLLKGAELSAVIPYIEEMGLRPSSPNRVIKGSFLGMDPARLRFIPEAVDYSKRPLQALRPFTPTLAANAAIEGSKVSSTFKFAMGPAWHEFGQTGATPGMFTLYTSAFAGKQGLGSGQGLIDISMRPAFERETIDHIIVAGYKVNEGLLAQLHTVGDTGLMIPRTKIGASLPREIGVSLPRDLILGYDPVTGAPRTAGITSGMEARIIGAQILPGAEGVPGEVKLTLKRKFRPEKFFHGFGDAKGMFEFTNINVKVAGIRANAVFHMDELRKNRDLQLKQMFTALFEFNRQNMQGMKANRRQTQFAIDPLKYAEQISRALQITDDISTAAGVRGIVSMAKEVGVTPEQAGYIFGSLAHTEGLVDLRGKKLAAAQLEAGKKFGLDPAWMKPITKGEAVGVSHVFFAGLGGEGAGTARASIEPRILEMMSTGHFGPMGPAMQKELIARRIATDPGMIASEIELSRSLETLGSKITAGKDMGFTDIRQLSAMEADPGVFGGGYVRINRAGLKDVYIPGEAAIREMTPYHTAAGKTMYTDLQYRYADFLQGARRMSAGDLSEAEFSKIHAQLGTAVGAAHAGTITGKGTGMMRGKLMGSRFLTGITRTAGTPDDIYRVGLGAEAFQNMYDEMLMAGMDKESMAGMRSRFLGGEDIGGLMLRHPFIGQYSASPVRYYLDKELSDSLVNIPIVKKKVVVNGVVKSLDWSITTGFAGDYDADLYGAVLMDPRHEGQLADMARTTSTFGREYEDFAIRTQLLKARSAGTESLSIAASRTAAATKMQISDQIGILSTKMTQAKRALFAHGKGDIGGALHFLEWLEQTPISAKHIKGSQAEALRKTIGNITQALQSGQTQDLITVARDMMDPEAFKFMQAGQRITVEGQERMLAGVNLIESMSVLRGALSRASGLAGEEISPRRLAELRFQSARMKLSEIPAYLSSQQGLFGALATGEEGMLRRVSRTAIEATNIMASLGAKVIKHAKPIGFGFAGALALSVVLSDPISSLSPGAGSPMVQAKFGNTLGDSVRADNIHPDMAALGQPTPPNILQHAPAPISKNSPTMSAFISINARSRHNFDTGALSNNLQAVLGPGTRVSTRVYDNRSSLTSQRITDIMER